MPRVKRGTTSHKRRKHVLSYAQGFRWGRKSKYKLAKDAMRHAWAYSFRDRRKKKGEKRMLWQVQIGSVCKQNGISYSKFINGLKKSNIAIDRKILSQLAQNYPHLFQKIAERAKV